MFIANVLLPLNNTFIDYPDPISNAILINIAGCPHGCIDCQNSDLQDQNYKNSSKISVDNLLEEILYNSEKFQTDKIVISGGDPLSPYNLDFTKALLDNVFNLFYTCIYTGYDINFIRKIDLRLWDFIKTGIYDKNLKQISGKTDECFSLASKNQCIYDYRYNLRTKDGILSFKSPGV
jgi:organic radical activating enzyme